MKIDTNKKERALTLSTQIIILLLFLLVMAEKLNNSKYALKLKILKHRDCLF